jgi:hypothetical protein
VIDLDRFRQIAAGDRLRGQYQGLSADPGSLANLDQDLPNNMQTSLPIHTLDKSWLWCETWCSDEALAEAKTIDLVSLSFFLFCVHTNRRADVLTLIRGSATIRKLMNRNWQERKG